LANQILTWGRPLPIEELIGRIDNVTVESARAAGSGLIARARPAIAALGPSKGLESAGTIVESFKRRAA
jgi:predicted Zn-dependent peptidase